MSIQSSGKDYDHPERLTRKDQTSKSLHSKATWTLATAIIGLITVLGLIIGRILLHARTVEKHTPIRSNDETYDRPERLDWLIGTFENHLARKDQAFESMNKKATWALATATGLAAASGFVKGTTIGTSSHEVINSLFAQPTTAVPTTIDYFIVGFAIAFAIIYLALLHFVIRVYRPQRFEYPVSPTNTEIGPIKSRHEDKGEYGTACWEDVMDRYILPNDIEYRHKVLRGYIDTNIVSQIKIDLMGRNLKWAFWLLYPLSFVSIGLLLVA